MAVLDAPRGPGGRAGFTMVELLVSLVIGAILVGTVFSFVNGQARAAGMQSAREEVQQNTRGALEIVASDLRGVLPQGIVTADRQELVAMVPLRWGVLCSITASTATVMFPADGMAAPPSDLGTGLLFRSNRLETTPAQWVPALPATAPVTAVQPGVLTACAGLKPEEPVAGSIQVFQFSGSGFPATQPAGSTVAVYQRVRYTVAAGTGGTWIYRSNGWTTATAASMQPLAGPVVSDSVRFSYFTAAGGATPLATPVGAPFNRGLSSVRFQVRMDSRQKVNRTGQQEQDSVTVAIRNRTAP